ncbi:hypothetical protein GCM10011571_16960 [Marinithermofilum abyssi]|uniref:DNase/tRNase domain of colicin-like bacteriocin n=1 Tax=Marinithermofilum abyssi TaxID=1571185 RepID=A0A8J2YDB4_9BACL|nr:hypothetical protein GCM10011571_16960 [Marinithermofilum abyssi]
MDGAPPVDIATDAIYGGIAGLISLGVFATTARVLGIFASSSSWLGRWFPRFTAGSTGGASDEASFQWLRKGEVNWKQVLFVGALAGLLSFGFGNFTDHGKKLVSLLPKGIQEIGQHAVVSADGPSGKFVSFIKGGATKQYPKVVIDERAGQTFTKEVNGEIRWRYINWKGKERTLYNGKYAGQFYRAEVNGETIRVPFDDNGFPKFEQWKAIDLKLDKELWFAKDKEQFVVLNKDVYLQMTKDEDLIRKIDEGFLEVIQKGVGDKNYPGYRKLGRFLKENPDLQRYIKPEERDLLEKGLGSEELYNRIISDEQILDKFRKANYKWIQSGEDPVGYTWHHHQDRGKMLLVKSRVHGYVKHVGGREIWGGGNERRN